MIFDLSKQPGFVVDIDDTLSDTSIACAEQVAETFGATLPENETIETLLSKYEYPWRFPQWSAVEYQRYIQKILQSANFLENIPPIGHAKAAIRKLTKYFPLNFYLTSRPINTQTTTENWLHKNHFPAAPVICRQPEWIKFEWKLEYIAQYAPDTIAFFDNEVHWNPEIKFAGKIFEIVRHCPHNDQTKNILVCKNWNEVMKNLLVVTEVVE